MIERFRALLDRPVGQRHARAVVFVASCLTVAFALLVALGVIDGSRPDPSPPEVTRTEAPTAPPTFSLSSPSAGSAGDAAGTSRPDPRQRDSDVFPARGKAAGRAALGVVEHLPYRRRHVAIELVGRRRGTVVIRVTARTGRGARIAWRRFLHRFHGDGRGFRVIFFADRGPRAGRSTAKKEAGAA